MENVVKPTGNVIMVASPEKTRNYTWYKNSENIKPGLQVISIEDIQKMDCGNIFGQENVLVNTLWMKHPYMPDRYVDVNRSEDAIVIDKFNMIGMIARHLGVTEYKTSYFTEEIAKREYDINGKVHYKVVESSLNIEIKKQDSKTGKYYRHETYAGEFSEESYEQAKRLSDQYKMDGDIYYILQNRNPKFVNPMKSQHIKVELTRELNEQLDIAFSLTATPAFALNTNYKQTIETRKRIIIDMELKF